MPLGVGITLWSINRDTNMMATSVTVPAYVPLVGYICTGWELKDDPCALSLGGGWHIPTKTECETTFSSVSKLSEAYSLLKIRNSGLFLGDSFGNETRAYIAISTLNNANYVSTIEFSNIAKTIGLGLCKYLYDFYSLC